MEHLPKNVDWDSVKVMLSVADRQSFRQAATELSKSVNTVRSTIDRLEDQLGFRLFHRETEGTKLTQEGRRIVSSARHVERSITDMCRAATSASDTMSGDISLAVTEGLGTFWLIPQLVPFLEGAGAGVRLNLQCATRSVDVLRMESDISIQLSEPTSPELIKRRLGFVHLSLFAGRPYADRYGLPTCLADLARHRVVEQTTDHGSGSDLYTIVPADTAASLVPLRTNVSSARYWAVAKGAGLGMMPNYAMAIGGDLVPVDIGLESRAELWLAIHPEIIKTRRHRIFVDWLVDCFSTSRFPWFGESGMSPLEVQRLLSASDEFRTYFDGFVPRPFGRSPDAKPPPSPDRPAKLRA